MDVSRQESDRETVLSQSTMSWNGGFSGSGGDSPPDVPAKAQHHLALSDDTKLNESNKRGNFVPLDETPVNTHSPSPSYILKTQRTVPSNPNYAPSSFSQKQHSQPIYSNGHPYRGAEENVQRPDIYDPAIQHVSTTRQRIAQIKEALPISTALNAANYVVDTLAPKLVGGAYVSKDSLDRHLLVNTTKQQYADEEWTQKNQNPYSDGIGKGQEKSFPIHMSPNQRPPEQIFENPSGVGFLPKGGRLNFKLVSRPQENSQAKVIPSRQNYFNAEQDAFGVQQPHAHAYYNMGAQRNDEPVAREHAHNIYYSTRDIPNTAGGDYQPHQRVYGVNPAVNTGRQFTIFHEPLADSSPQKAIPGYPKSSSVEQRQGHQNYQQRQYQPTQYPHNIDPQYRPHRVTGRSQTFNSSIPHFPADANVDYPSTFRRDRYPSSMSTASSTRSVIRGSKISFHNIRYVVKSKKYPWSKVEKKTVLKNISGIVKPGMNAIMGPTGGGKSSLLDVLAGRKNPKYLEGHVLVDGRPQPANFKCMSGYVLQDDIVMGTLTVKENLLFSAALRLPKKIQERQAKVDEVLEELGLSHVANSKIGTELIRGVSGGERKRCNIGIELITDPSVLFLDEPTTGLDAFTANSVIKTLRNLALRGRTIVFSIHQPKYSIYKLFDTLTLVCKGELIYHGPADNHPLNYFQTLGYVCEAHNNPTDFFLDILHGEVKPNRSLLEQNRLRKSFDDGDDIPMSGIDAVILHVEEERNVSEHLIKYWKDSLYNTRVQREVKEIFKASGLADGSCTEVRGKDVSYHTPFMNQMLYVCWRTALNLMRNPQASVVQLIVYLFFALSTGVVFRGMNASTESGYQNRMGLFFFSTLQMVFVNLGAIEIFIKERQIFIHETSSGFYRTSAYFIAKIFCDMLPIKAAPVVIFMPITYWMVGLKKDAGAFFFFELVLLLTTVAACGAAFFISASVSVFGIANILISLLYVFMMIFGGYLINIKTMGDWLNWCQFLSIFRYSISGLSMNELVGIEFCPLSNITSGSCKMGETFLMELDIPFSTSWHRWCNILGLTIISIVFFALCYIQLRRIKRFR